MTRNPRIACVMLVNGRPAMVRRAVACYRAQTYEPRSLLLYDTGSPWIREYDPDFDETDITMIMRNGRGQTIGQMRNHANELAISECGADIIAHWDSDDWSAPTRLEEQLGLLERAGCAVVGYNDGLFWNGREAWLYKASGRPFVLGASLCYMREAWQKKAFQALPKRPGDRGEDSAWTFEWAAAGELTSETSLQPEYGGGPRMLFAIHEGNSQKYDVENHPLNWQRAPGWNDYCARIMSL